ncbi:MAG TPA: thioredoxin family protein [Oculatellaceae cyanobacterium]|jgi:peroxiredoxin
MFTENILVMKYAPDFELPGIDLQVHHLAQYLKEYLAVGVIFMCNHCPTVRQYLERLRQIQIDFLDQGFTLIGINANQYPDDSLEKMKTFAEQMQLNFPYLRDTNQDVAQTFGAEKTPEVFLLNNQGILCYSGAIDDRPEDPAAVEKHYLREAIANVIQGESVTIASTPAIGSAIQWGK